MTPIRSFLSALFAHLAVKLNPGVKTISSRIRGLNLIWRKQQILRAVNENNIYTVFQPILDVRTGEIFGYEALTRLEPEGVFADISELLNASATFGLYETVEKVLTLLAIDTFKERAREDKKHRLFINISPSSIYYGTYADEFKKKELFQGLKIAIELVERQKITPMIIKLLRKEAELLDFLIVVDDFGEGYSNYASLLYTKPHIIKISREILSNIDKEPEKQHLFENIVDLIHGMNIQVLAEGVETEEEFITVLRFGADYVQGYYVAKPNRDLVLASEESKRLVHRRQEIDKAIQNANLR